MAVAVLVGDDRVSTVATRAAGTAPAHALEVKTPSPSRIVREQIPSGHLRRDIPVAVYLPEGYATSTRRYPILYLLHGAGGDDGDWTSLAKIQDLADGLIAAGTIPPAVIAMPSLRDCWWVDGARDKAESAFWSDLVPAVESRYRTVKSRSGRLLAGLSAGGYGAIRFGLKYPDQVGAVAAMSPAIYAEAPPELSAARKQPPFLKANGEFDEARWNVNNYPRLLQAYFAQKHRVPMYISAGDGDALGIAYEAALFHKRLRERQPDMAELRVMDGSHDWTLWTSTLADAIVFVFRSAKPEVTVAASPRSPGGRGQHKE